MNVHGKRIGFHIPDKIGWALTTLGTAASLTLCWGFVALHSCVSTLFHMEGIYRGWMAKMLLNRFVSDPFGLQYLQHEGGSVIFGLFLVPVFHFLGDSLFHLALGSVLWQSLVVALVTMLCWNVWGPRAALWAGFFFICAPMSYIQRAFQALSNHCEIPLFALLNTLILWRILTKIEGRKNNALWAWTLLGVVNGIGLYFSYEHAPVLAADLLVLLPILFVRSIRPRKIAAALAMAFTGLCIGFSPWFYVLQTYYHGNVKFMLIVGEPQPFWTAFRIGDPFGKLVTIWELFRSAMMMNMDRLNPDAISGITVVLLPFLSKAVFIIFPVATTLAFIVLTLLGILRLRFTATRGIEVWCVLYLVIHLLLCWTFQSYSKVKPEYFFPLFPLFCAMAGSVLSGEAGIGRRFLTDSSGRLMRVFQLLLAGVILGLAFSQWQGVITQCPEGKSANLRYRGFSNRATKSFFLDPIARVNCERLRLMAVRYNNSSGAPWGAFLTSPTVEEFMACWNNLSRGILEGNETLEQSLPAIVFNLGQIAGHEGRGIEEVRKDLEPAVPERLRHFLYMGYTYFLRLDGLVERDRVMEFLDKVDPRYGHYFLMAHGACLGMKYRNDPDTLTRIMGNDWPERDRGYVAAGILWTPASVKKKCATIVEHIPEPIRAVLMCERLGSDSLHFDAGVLGVRNAMSSILFDPHYFKDPVGVRLDIQNLVETLEGSAGPAEAGLGAGAALALAIPWKIPFFREDLDLFPGELQGDFFRGYVEASLWLLGGDEGSMPVPSQSIRDKPIAPSQ